MNHNDIPIHSHVICVSLTTSQPRSTNETAAWARGVLQKAGQLPAVMSGPCGLTTSAHAAAFALAAVVLQTPEEQLPEHIRPFRKTFQELAGNG